METAVAGVTATLNTLRDAINTHGATLDYTHVTGLYDAGYLNDGYTATDDAKITASDSRGATSVAFTVGKVNGYNDATGIINVAVTVTGNGGDGPFTDVFDLAFKRQGDGTYRMYGNQRIARPNVFAEVRTEVRPPPSTIVAHPTTIGPLQSIYFEIEAPVGVLAGAQRVTATPNLWSTNSISSTLRTLPVEGSPPPAPAQSFDRSAYFFQLFVSGATPVPTGTMFEFNLTKADSSTLTYSVPVENAVANVATSAITNVTINGTTATRFGQQVLNSPINVAWTLPSGFTVKSVNLTPYAQNGSLSAQCFGTISSRTTASAQIALPVTCGGVTSARGAAFIQVDGVNGERSVFAYQFDIVPATGPVIAFSPANLDFGDVPLEQPSGATQTITVYNSGSGTLSISSAQVTGDGFAATRNTCTGAGLSAFQSCSVTVGFTPPGNGWREGGILIVSADGSQQVVRLQGIGTATTVTHNLAASWNLIGNGSNGPFDVAKVLGDIANVSTVWKWNAGTGKWAFYTPALESQALSDYAAGKGYEVLSTVGPGEGIWVNAKQAFSVQLPAGSTCRNWAFLPWGSSPLGSGWNLVALGETRAPSDFNSLLSKASLSGHTPPELTTLWAWDAAQAGWYFYAPSLEKSGGLASYIAGKGYLDFSTINRKLGIGVGFWVNMP